MYLLEEWELQREVEAKLRFDIVVRGGKTAMKWNSFISHLERADRTKVVLVMKARWAVGRRTLGLYQAW